LAAGWKRRNKKRKEEVLDKKLIKKEVLKILRAELSDPKVLKICMDIISNITDEANLVATGNGLRMRAVDSAHVVLAELALKKEIFDTYELEGESERIGLDLIKFSSVLKRAGTKDRLILQADSRNGKIEITFRGESSTRTFTMPLVEVSEEVTNVPALDFPAMVEIESKTFENAIKDAEIVGDHVVLRAEEENLYISACGELGEAETKIPREDTYYFTLKRSAGRVKSMFSIEYLKDMIKAKDVAKTLKIHLGRDMPVRLEYIRDGAELRFLLAPRIANE